MSTRLRNERAELACGGKDGSANSGIKGGTFLKAIDSKKLNQRAILSICYMPYSGGHYG